jgi:AcrR family transcriptional regulator
MPHSLLMSQAPKDHVRDAFVAAAGAAFSELGYEGTRMAAVAERAGSSVGNLYRYFPDKEALFRAVVPDDLVRELERRTRARVRAFGAAKDVKSLPHDASYHALSEELLDYCLQHRAAVVIVLARAEGTPYSAFAERFVEALVGWSLDYARVAYPELCITAELRWVLRRAYFSFVTHIADALLHYPNEARTRSVLALLTAHHQGGLKNLFQTAGGPDAEPSHAETPPLSDPAALATAGDPRPGDSGPTPARARSRKADRRGGTGRRR